MQSHTKEEKSAILMLICLSAFRTVYLTEHVFSFSVTGAQAYSHFILEVTLKVAFGWVPEAHTCNPSSSEGRDQKDQGSKPALANSLPDPYLEIFNTKQGWRSGCVVCEGRFLPPLGLLKILCKKLIKFFSIKNVTEIWSVEKRSLRTV
jgi:hypothetical protein